jgi:hypothetical protein
VRASPDVWSVTAPAARASATAEVRSVGVTGPRVELVPGAQGNRSRFAFSEGGSQVRIPL